MTDIDKSFTGVQALKKVSFDLRRGEIHALVGENGAGKSTLMKVLTGIHDKDAGGISYLGHPFNPRNPKHALSLGIGIIHQELNMMDHLTVAQNVYIGQESTVLGGLFLSEKKQNRRTSELFKRLNININPSDRLGDLSVGKQQMVEIAKTVANDNLQILILDEPTAALTNREIEELFRIMRDLASQGVAMVHISHRLDEIEQIADRVTVLRDGENAGTRDVKDTSKADIIKMMVGRAVFEQPKEASRVPEDAEVVLRVRNLSAGRMVQNVSFDLHRGEILGFAGLIGAGRTETARAVFGADAIDSGHIEIHGKPAHITSPEDAVRHGIGYLSEDRKRYGLAVKMSVSENSVMASYDRFSKAGFVQFGKVARATREYVDKLNIRTPSIEQIIRNLSGGNQQKVVIAKWLIQDSDILIFDEPTRGIDVGAKSEIYTLMNSLAEQGKAIIMISSELPEILRMSDRVAVMCEGRLTGILDIAEADQESIMHYATMRETGVATHAEN
ncbi:MAG: sugar ABC transporter ATP-binding protein [Spirochaetaceae bacterium]|nr:MAG: sugar ABC transporter ATP-binding protein [Spirochaetaceae bacterium]